jgi:hypothetical protein
MRSESPLAARPAEEFSEERLRAHHDPFERARQS